MAIKKRIDRVILIDLGHSKYWSVIFTDGSYKHLSLNKKNDLICRPFWESYLNK
jgi:hypothetical protein